MINKVTLKELNKDIFRRSTLISIPGLNEFFEIEESDYTSWEVFYGIVREALQKFEYYYPYNFIQKLYIEVNINKRTARTFDNFKAYLDGIVSEDQLTIMPSSVQGLALNGYTASIYPLRNFRYEPPEFRDFWYSTNVYYANTLINRPLFEEYNEVSKEPTDRCALYFMNKDGDSQYKIFRDQLYVELCRYIVNMKKNMILPNMPIEVFQGLEEDMQKVESQLEQIYQNALVNSAWLI
jgi:hypothetical protein